MLLCLREVPAESSAVQLQVTCQLLSLICCKIPGASRIFYDFLQVFELMKNRDVVMEKMSLHTIDGWAENRVGNLIEFASSARN